MILKSATAASLNGRQTLDGLVRRAASAEPDAMALSDAANRTHLIGGEARHLRWGELDARVDALAAALLGHGLTPDTVVATQFALSSDGVVALLAILRAGMIAAPLPLGWGRREIAGGLQRLGARAILCAGRAGPVPTADLMRHAAAETFSVRHVFSLGEPVLDGVIPLDEALTAMATRVETARSGAAADHVALVTQDATPEGAISVARSHNEVIAACLGPFIAGAPDERSVIAATIGLDGIAGIALQLGPWLLSGAHLIAHSPFAARVFAASLTDDGVTHAVAPVRAARLFAGGAARLRSVCLLARGAEDAALSAGVALDGVAVERFFAAGELAVLPLAADGTTATLKSGPETFATSASQAPTLAVVEATEGRLVVSGAMTPSAAFPPGVARTGLPHLSVGADGRIDAGFSVAPAGGGLFALTGDPAGVVAIGGRRFSESDLRAAYALASDGGTARVRQDATLGRRVAGVSGDGRALTGLAQRLDEAGLSPLLVPGAARIEAQLRELGPPTPVEVPVANLARAG